LVEVVVTFTREIFINDCSSKILFNKKGEDSMVKKEGKKEELSWPRVLLVIWIILVVVSSVFVAWYSVKVRKQAKAAIIKSSGGSAVVSLELIEPPKPITSTATVSLTILKGGG